MPLTVIGLLGTQLDRGQSVRRWERWRPTVSIAQHDDLLVDRFVLLYPPERDELAQQVIDDMGRVSPETDFVLEPLPLTDPWDFQEVYGALADFAHSFDFDEDHEYWVHISTGSHVAQICLFLLTETRHFPGKLLQTGPPRRGTGSAAGTWSVIDLDLARYDRIADRFAKAGADARSFLKAGIDTRSPSFNRLIERVEQVAVHSDAPILLTGPTGAGKTQLARQIHGLKRERRLVAGPLVSVNCATLRGDSATSALFGHTRGAFTGAERERAGLLRSADGGVLFLDEVGELGPDEQALLLTAIEKKRWLPVGSDREVHSDFLLIAGSNRDLRAEVRAGRFREDLLARIDLWHFELPGLADRPEDIEPNLDFELAQWTARTGRRVAFNREARARYLAFATGPEGRWTANFRDLNASVTRMATLAGGQRIDGVLVDEELARLRRAWRAQGEPGPTRVQRVLGVSDAAALDRFDRVQLEDVLDVCARSPSMSAAGRVLFAESLKQRTSKNDADRLRKYLLRFGLSWGQVGP